MSQPQQYPAAKGYGRYTPPTVDLEVMPDGLVPITETRRGIHPETYALYGVMQDDEGNHYYPYRTGHHLVGYKVRTTKNKRFEHHWGDVRAVTMWRPTTQTSGNRYLVITEGEVDAMTVHQLTGYTTWSIPLGAPSAHVFLARAADELARYENVYLLLDNDVYGRKAVEQVTQTLPKLKVVNLPPQYKDPNDLLKSLQGNVDEAAQVLKSCLWGANPAVSPLIHPKSALAVGARARLFDPDKRVGVSTGLNGLDNLIGGIRGGEMTLIVGGTGTGKSSILRQVVHNTRTNPAYGDDSPVLYISLEDPPETAVVSLMELHYGRPLLGLEAPDVDPEQFEQDVANIEGVELANVSADPDAILALCEYQARLGTKLVVLDHLTVLSEQLTLGEFNKFVYALADLAKDMGFSVLAANHLNRDKQDKHDNGPTLARVKNSSSLQQVFWCVLGYTRDRSSNLCRLVTLKNMRGWGVAGDAWFVRNPKTMQLTDTGCPEPEDDDDEDDYNPTTEDW